MAMHSTSRSMVAPSILGAAGSARITTAVPWPWPLPMNSVLGVFDGDATTQTLRHALRETEAGDADIWVLSGSDGARRLRAAFEGRNALSRVRSLLGGEDEVLAQLEERLTRGGIAVLVRPLSGDARHVAAAFAAHGARCVRRSGQLTSEWRVLRA